MADILERYASRASALRERERDSARTSRRLSWARVAVALLVVVQLWLATRVGAPARIGIWSVVAIALVGFIALVVAHGRVKRRQDLLGELASLNEHGVARVERRWNELTEERLDAAPADHPYAIDLDITGPGSLSRLLPPLSAALGKPMLRDWLLTAAEPSEITERQAAVAELAGMNDLRDVLAVHAGRSGLGSAHVRGFERWASEDAWWSRRTMLVWATRLIPLAILSLASAGAAGLVTGRLWLIPLVIGGAITYRHRKRVTLELRRASTPSSVFRAYREMAIEIARARFSSPRLIALQSRLMEGEAGAERAMRSLQRLADSAELRHSGLQYVLVQALTMWDFHVLHGLERWRARVGARVPTWFDAIAELECLAALATLAHDNPDWTFPRVERSDAPAVRARGLGHPLLRAGARVSNDVIVGPPGRFLFVTGSNMSGKSTLIRAIGLNVVLAQAGSAACATELVLAPVELHTSMRVQDSLERGVSLFMAEVERLRKIVDAARLASERGDTVLYLLDEILHGTNSTERTIAARGVLRHLVKLGAIGAVTSHDLQLAESIMLREAAVAVHFREEVAADGGSPIMHFDYVLRDGTATTRNALRLMEQMGLPVDEGTGGDAAGR